jgi:hypothetical protein
MTDADTIIQELGCGPNDVVSHPAAATVEDLVRVFRLTSRCVFLFGRFCATQLDELPGKPATHGHAFALSECTALYFQLALAFLTIVTLQEVHSDWTRSVPTCRCHRFSHPPTVEPIVDTAVQRCIYFGLNSVCTSVLYEQTPSVFQAIIASTTLQLIALVGSYLPVT